MNVGADGGRPNKSARKREIAALLDLAEQMLGLSDGELARLDVPTDLRKALDDVRPMRPSGARNRQLKHCVRLMDADELNQVVEFLSDRHSQRVIVNQALHEIESWRDRLIADGDRAVSALLDRHPDVDRQRLRQLSRDAIRERDAGKPAGAGRKLFRYLRDEVFGDNT